MKELGLDAYPVKGRIALAEEIWASVEAEVAAATPNDAQAQELARRLADSRANTGVGTPWEEVKARAAARWPKRLPPFET